MTSNVTDASRFFILNVGRSGSSLLSAILADAGAEFGLQVPDSWDPRHGTMEGPAIKRAAHHYRRAYDIAAGRKFVWSPRLEAKLRLMRGRKYLIRALLDSRFLKIGDLDLVVQPSFRLGYAPSVILNYRQLEMNLPSLLVGRTNVGADELANEYLRVYRQGLMLMYTFGGCAIAYNELLDLSATSWADALGEATGFGSRQLLESRERRLQGTPDPTDTRPIYPEAYSLFKELDALRGQIIRPSRQVQRARRPAE